jgi:Kef-type K+ transport system membrane component KefB
LDDVAAWSLLAIVLSLLKGNATLALLAIGGGALFVLFAFTLGRKFLALMVGRLNNPKFGKSEKIAFVFVLLALSAWTTERLGLHAVFGSFLMGVAFPKGESAHSTKEAIEPFTAHLLLPIFFVYTGLNTRIDLLISVEFLAVAALVLLVSCAGKIVACGLAARMSGFSRADSLAVGSLMNARGLMELIILNIGLEQGIITPVLFSIMVSMAVLTTVIASPLFRATRMSPRLLKSFPWRKAA